MDKYTVVIWGHKLHSHTHSYIHNAYYRAFRKMGFTVLWLDDGDDISVYDLNKCIFLTEGQVDSKIPLIKEAFYILHHCDVNKYKDYKYINLCNYVNDCTLGISYNFPGGKCQKINYYTYYDYDNKALYQPWATDRFPEEIPDVPREIEKSCKSIYYVGTVWEENVKELRKLKKSAISRGFSFKNLEEISEDGAIDAVISSYVSPDIRGTHHRNVGYIPCRIFKNISYGIIPATNSIYVSNFFGHKLPFCENASKILSVNEEYLTNVDNLQNSKNLIQEIKQNHTYLNRVTSILDFIKIIYK
jgi:hypothetical protein